MNRNVRGRLLIFSAFVAAAATVGLLGKPGKANPRELQQGDSFPPTTHRRSRSLAEPSKRQDLGLFPRPRSPVFNVPPGDELTMRQLYDCLTELVAACQSSGFADLL
uniref:Secreted protein n=1 Tax=Macrostomum lignano TaxID=282301 RepID=A0A1I8G546_9PLAT